MAPAHGRRTINACAGQSRNGRVTLAPLQSTRRLLNALEGPHALRGRAMQRHRRILLVTLLTGIVIALAMAMSQTRDSQAAPMPAWDMR
jgi:hypothetical protein